jgi:SAM-dependent methyltransferase
MITAIAFRRILRVYAAWGVCKGCRSMVRLICACSKNARTADRELSANRTREAQSAGSLSGTKSEGTPHMANEKKHLCPWWLGWFLASPIRKWSQDPNAIVGPYLRDGMTVLEPGPGMGFFTLEMAKKIGSNGRVIAVDIQKPMLDGVVRRAKRAGLQDRISTRLVSAGDLGLADIVGSCDFALLFAVVHEVPDAASLFQQVFAALKPGASLLFSEPKGHVTRPAFEASLKLAEGAGFVVESEPTIARSHSALLRKPS